MDLRTHYSCWLSKPLPLDLPFGRLLCFEKLDIIEKLILLKKIFNLVFFLHASLKFWRNYNLPQDIVSVTFWHFLTKIHIPVKETGYRGNIKRLHCVDCWYPFFFIQFNLTSGYFRVVGNAKFHFKRGAFLKNKYTCMTFSSIE